jgi:hypothetical protein
VTGVGRGTRRREKTIRGRDDRGRQGEVGEEEMDEYARNGRIEDEE